VCLKYPHAHTHTLAAKRVIPSHTPSLCLDFSLSLTHVSIFSLSHTRTKMPAATRRLHAYSHPTASPHAARHAVRCCALQQRVAAACCSSVLQQCFAAVCCSSMLQQCVAALRCSSVLQQTPVATRPHHANGHQTASPRAAYLALRCRACVAAVCCSSVLQQCVAAVCCSSVLQ